MSVLDFLLVMEKIFKLVLPFSNTVFYQMEQMLKSMKLYRLLFEYMLLLLCM